MKISILSHDLSNNCLGRAYVLARLLSARYDTEIVGPVRGVDVWAPLRDDTCVKYRQLEPGAGIRAALRAVDGDVLYAVKPKGPSLGLGLLARLARRRPLIADVDDWEMAFFLDNPRWMLRNLAQVFDPTNLYSTWALERAVGRVDGTTVSSTALRRRFGGVLIPHARHDATLDPEGFDGTEVRRDLGIEHRTVVLFLGSGRAHKGLRTVVEALDQLGDPSVAFVVVGPDMALPPRPYLTVLPPQPYDRMPRFLAAADIVVLAQHPTRAACAQIPAKLFDAMAMATPVIATSVSDLPEILDGCGLVVEPADPRALAGAIASLVGDPSRARRLGAAGRARFLSSYSVDAVRGRLEEVVETACVRSGR